VEDQVKPGQGSVVVAVAGGGRNAGKTALICRLLGHFPGAAAVKWSHHEAGGRPSVTDDPGAVLVRRKDTLRMKKAGSGKVILVWGGGDGAAKKFKKALALAGGFSPVFIEGGAAFDFDGTDVRIFVEKDGRGGGKNGAGRRAGAHLAVSLKNLGAEKISLLVRKLMGGREREMMRAVLRRTRGGVISCAAARRAAGEAKAPPAQIGRLCTETGIRIDDCVLGCFGRYKEKKRSVVDEVRGGLEAKQKVWMEKSGRLVMGEGRSKLLRAVQQEGSINRAAKACRLGYRRAWAMLHSIEQAAGRRIVKTSIGGSSGGGTRVTPYGKELLRYYDKLSARAQRVLEEEMRYETPTRGRRAL
jgi:molybdate transport system regulatory protein